jgi:DNA-binding transcriptional LysR family regulator
VALDGVDLHPGVLQQFLVLADARDVDRAASRLAISTTALRKSIRALERQLRTTVFVHDTRVFELTAGGAALVAPAQKAVSAAARFKASMRAIEGVLRVAHPPSGDTLAIVLDRYAERHPDVRIEERVLPCDAQLLALRDREIDVALCRLDTEPAADYHVELLRLDPILAAVAPRAGVAPLSVDPARMPTYVGESRGEWSARDSFIASFERATGSGLNRVQAPIGGGLYIAALERSRAPVFLMMSSSLAVPTERCLVGLVPLQPYFPWSLVWPTEPSAAVGRFIETARVVAADRAWLAVDGLPGTPWLPEDDPHRPRVHASRCARVPMRVQRQRDHRPTVATDGSGLTALLKG